MSRFDKIKLAVCIALHVYVLWNVYQMSLLTPRIINIVSPDECVEYVPEDYGPQGYSA